MSLEDDMRALEADPDNHAVAHRALASFCRETPTENCEVFLSMPDTSTKTWRAVLEAVINFDEARRPLLIKILKCALRSWPVGSRPLPRWLIDKTIYAPNYEPEGSSLLQRVWQALPFTRVKEERGVKAFNLEIMARTGAIELVDCVDPDTLYLLGFLIANEKIPEFNLALREFVDSEGWTPNNFEMQCLDQCLQGVSKVLSIAQLQRLKLDSYSRYIETFHLAFSSLPGPSNLHEFQATCHRESSLRSLISVAKLREQIKSLEILNAGDLLPEYLAFEWPELESLSLTLSAKHYQIPLICAPKLKRVKFCVDPTRLGSLDSLNAWLSDDRLETDVELYVPYQNWEFPHSSVHVNERIRTLDTAISMNPIPVLPSVEAVKIRSIQWNYHEANRSEGEAAIEAFFRSIPNTKSLTIAGRGESDSLVTSQFFRAGTIEHLSCPHILNMNSRPFFESLAAAASVSLKSLNLQLNLRPGASVEPWLIEFFESLELESFELEFFGRVSDFEQLFSVCHTPIRKLTLATYENRGRDVIRVLNLPVFHSLETLVVNGPHEQLAESRFWKSLDLPLLKSISFETSAAVIRSLAKVAEVEKLSSFVSFETRNYMLNALTD